MTLKQIEFYEAVCQAGNVTAAAQQLYVSRSVISRAIQELEDELDIQLFVRGRNGMELTEYGKTLRKCFRNLRGFIRRYWHKSAASRKQEKTIP